MGPELLNPESFGLRQSRPTRESDCYALGMVIYKVLSGNHPFFPRSGPIIMMDILNDERPRRPEGDEGELFTDDVWGMLELCWKRQPSARASVKAVLRCLEGTLGGPGFLADEGVEEYTEDESDTIMHNSSEYVFSVPPRTSDLTHNR